jgi:hypothetical protein
MKVLARSGPDSWKRPPIVHIPVVDNSMDKARALCSPGDRYPCEGVQLKDGAVWVVRDGEPGDVMCARCRAAHDKLNAPPEPEPSAWDKLSKREQRFFENWEIWNKTRHKKDPRGKNDGKN